MKFIVSVIIFREKLGPFQKLIFHTSKIWHLNYLWSKRPNVSAKNTICMFIVFHNKLPSFAWIYWAMYLLVSLHHSISSRSQCKNVKLHIKLDKFHQFSHSFHCKLVCWSYMLTQIDSDLFHFKSAASVSFIAVSGVV